MAGEARGVITVEDRASATLRNIEAAASAVGTAIGVSIGGALSLGATVLSSYALGVKKIIEEADGLNDVSQKLGIGVAQLGAYKLAAEQSGTSIESIGRGIKSLSVAALKHGDALRQAGIDTQDADKAMRQIADLFAAMPDGMEKAALATKLFGRAGLELIPMLNQGSAGLEQSALKSAEYARQMAILAPNADALNDKMTEMDIAVKALYANMANRLVPGMTDIATAMTMAAKESGVLMALWVGLGGLATETANAIGSVADAANARYQMSSWLGLGDSKSAVDTLKEVNAELATLEANAARAKAAGFEVPLLDAQRIKHLQSAQRGLMEITGEAKSTGGAMSDAAAVVGAAAEKIGGAMSAAEKRARGLLGALGGIKEKADPAVKELERLVAAIESKGGAVDLGMSADTYKSLDKLSEAFDEGRISAEKYNRLMGILIDTDEKMTQEERDKQKAIADAQKQYDDYFTRLDDANNKLAEEIQYYGQARSAIEYANVARYQEAKAIAERLELSPDILATYDREIEAASRRATLLDSKDVLDAEKKAREESTKQWERMTDDVEQSLADAIMGGGKSGGELLERYFKTLILTPTIKAAMAPVSNAIGSALGYNTSGSALNAASSGISAANLFGLGGGASLASLGMANAVGAAGGDSLGALIAGNSSAWGVEAGGVSGLAGAVSWMPWVAGAAALASAFGLFDHKGGPKISGQGLAVFGDNGQFTTPDTWNISNPTTKPGRWYGTQVWDGAANPQFQGAMDTFATGVASYLSRIGLDTKGLSFGLGGDTDPQGTAGDFVRAAVVRNGAEVYSREYEAERGKGQEAVQLELQRMLLATVKSAGDSLYTDAIGSLDIANATADQLTAKLNEIEAIHNVVSSIGDAYTTTLAEQAGGIANLSALVTSYNQAAYTDAEKQKQQTDALADVFESLGLSVPATMEEYRKLVDAQDTLTASGAAARVQLMGVAAAMAEEAKRAEALANQKRDMEIQILELEGRAVEATALKRQAELSALDESLRPLQERIYALQDEQGAVAQATQSAAAFVETMNRYSMGMEKGRDILTPSADAIGALSGGDYGKTLQMQQEYLQATLADLQAQLRNATDFRQYDYLTGQIGGVEDVLARMRSEYERYMSFETQNPGYGQALMELENWYNAQKALADHNASALALIEAAYWQKRQDILASATDAERSQLETWLRNLEQGPQSPLSPQAQYEAAAKRYADMMASGDMSHYTEYADAYLKAAEAMYGHGGDYTAIYNEIVANARDQIDGEMRANDHRVEQIAETRTTNNELRLLRAEVAQMRMDMGRATERTGSLTRNELINATRAIIDGANKQAAATERAAQLAKTQ